VLLARGELVAVAVMMTIIAVVLMTRRRRRSVGSVGVELVVRVFGRMVKMTVVRMIATSHKNDGARKHDEVDRRREKPPAKHHHG
jgi:hypothetical protein